MAETKENWDMVITPKDRLLTLDYKEIWRYRDMFYLFVMRNFRTAYKQTILGPLWFLITPILSVIVYVAVFGGIANIPTDGLPPVLFYLLGISVWRYCQYTNGRTASGIVLPIGYIGLGVFCQLPEFYIQLLCIQCRYIRQSLFSAYYHAVGCCHNQSPFLCNSIRHLFCVLHLLRMYRY